MENYNENGEVMNFNAPVVRESGALMDVGGDNIVELAKTAQERMNAIKVIMEASLSVTTEKDWCLIQGQPYLQETGAAKVARLFGVSWKMQQPEIITDSKGYKTYIFKGVFYLKNDNIEAEGSRSMKDDFFSRIIDKNKSTKDNPVYTRKSPDEIDEMNVRQSAYTNCINNGIKRLLPGLRNITLDSLSNAGIKVEEISGYSFNTNKKPAKKAAEPKEGDIVCEGEDCNEVLTQAVATFSKKNYGKHLCMKCQQKAKEEQKPKTEVADTETAE